MKFTLKHLVLVALPVAGLLTTPTFSVAHDDDWRSSPYYDSPADEHEAYHEDREARHEAFHSMPHNRREHRRFHRAEKRAHRAEHRDLDNAWGGYGDRDWYRGRDEESYYGRGWER